MVERRGLRAENKLVTGGNFHYSRPPRLPCRSDSGFEIRTARLRRLDSEPEAREKSEKPLGARSVGRENRGSGLT
jgi:hypothetical protein